MNGATPKTPWIGQSVARLEDPPLVTGRGQFAGDINFPHQLTMRIVRSAHAHGRDADQHVFWIKLAADAEAAAHVRFVHMDR